MGLNISTKFSYDILMIDELNNLIDEKIRRNEEYIITFCYSIEEFHSVWKKLKISDIYRKTVPYSFSMKGHPRDELWNLAVIDLNQDPIKIELLKDKTLKSKILTTSHNPNTIYKYSY